MNAMTGIESNILRSTINLKVFPHENGRYCCQLSSSFSNQPSNSEVFYGETQDHAIAVALEHQAAHYRNEAEQKQDEGLSTEDALLAKHAELKQYHVILHYERITGAESKFDALQNTLMGNTVVENATCTLIELSEDAQQRVIT
jgi:6-phosphofructokinase